MNTRLLPQELAKDVMFRSTCNVMVGAVLADKHGIFSWGWNHTKYWAPASSTGSGVHAEIHALMRANPSRLRGSEIYVIGLRRRNKKFVEALPCPDCMSAIKRAKIKKITFFDSAHWQVIYL